MFLLFSCGCAVAHQVPQRWTYPFSTVLSSIAVELLARDYQFCSFLAMLEPSLVLLPHTVMSRGECWVMTALLRGEDLLPSCIACSALILCGYSMGAIQYLVYSACSNPQCSTTLSCRLVGDRVSGQRGCADFPIHAQAIVAEKNLQIQNRKRASGTRQLHPASRLWNSSSRRTCCCSFYHYFVSSRWWRLPSLHPEDATCSILSEPTDHRVQSRSKLWGVGGESVSCCVLSMCEIPVECT